MVTRSRRSLDLVISGHEPAAKRPDHQGTDAGDERELEPMRGALANAVGRLGEAAGTEGALVEALDRERIVGGFRRDRDGGFAHGLIARSRSERIPFEWNAIRSNLFYSGACPCRKTGVHPRLRKGMLFRDMR